MSVLITISDLFAKEISQILNIILKVFIENYKQNNMEKQQFDVRVDMVIILRMYN